MNRVLLQDNVKKSIASFERSHIRDFIYRSENSKFLVRADVSETGYPVYDFNHDINGIYNTLRFDIIIESIESLVQHLEDSERLFVYDEWKKYLLVSTERVLKTLTHFESMTNGGEKEEVLDALKLGIEWIEEEIKTIEHKGNLIDDDEVIRSNGYTDKELFTLLRELGLFETQIFVNLSPKKRDTILSILLRNSEDYSKKLFNSNNPKYTDHKKYGISDEILKKVRNIISD